MQKRDRKLMNLIRPNENKTENTWYKIAKKLQLRA